jgi:HEAT repeat protein
MYTVNQSEIAQWVNLLEEKGAARLHALSQLGRIGIQARGHRSLQRGSLRTSARSFLTPVDLAQLVEALSDPLTGRRGEPCPEQGRRAVELSGHRPASVVRRETAFVLGELGGEAAISVLGRLAADSNADVRLIAVDALAKIGGPQAVQALTQVTYDDSELVRARAVHALGRLVRGEEGPEVVPIRGTLTRIWQEDASDYVRDAAREALVALEGEEFIEVPAPVPEPL